MSLQTICLASFACEFSLLMDGRHLNYSNPHRRLCQQVRHCLLACVCVCMRGLLTTERRRHKPEFGLPAFSRKAHCLEREPVGECACAKAETYPVRPTIEALKLLGATSRMATRVLTVDIVARKTNIRISHTLSNARTRTNKQQDSRN